MHEELEANLQKTSTWKRIFFMLLFAVIVSLVRLLLWGVVALQVGSVLITGNVNQHVLGFGRSLSAYLYHIYLFLSFNTEQLAFPFASWEIYKQEHFQLDSNNI